MSPSPRRRTTPGRRAAGGTADRTEQAAAFWADVRARHPRFTVAVAADARMAAARRGERHEFRSRADLVVQVLRLCLVTESFLGQVCYRAKARCQSRGIPLVPRLLNHAAVRNGQIAIGDPVVVEEGVFIPHGQVVVDGIVRIGRGTVLGPFSTIGLRSGDYVGPTLGARVAVGTGARILGPWTIGEGATIGANAVVTSHIPAGATAVGVPARLRPATAAPADQAPGSSAPG
jgi:serine O-acetyltransferase